MITRAEAKEQGLWVAWGVEWLLHVVLSAALAFALGLFTWVAFVALRYIWTSDAGWLGRSLWTLVVLSLYCGLVDGFRWSQLLPHKIKCPACPWGES